MLPWSLSTSLSSIWQVSVQSGLEDVQIFQDVVIWDILVILCVSSFDSILPIFHKDMLFEVLQPSWIWELNILAILKLHGAPPTPADQEWHLKKKFTDAWCRPITRVHLWAHHARVIFCLFCLIQFFTSQSTIFQLCWDGSSWVEPVLSKDKSCLAQGHNKKAWIISQGAKS